MRLLSLLLIPLTLTHLGCDMLGLDDTDKAEEKESDGDEKKAKADDDEAESDDEGDPHGPTGEVHQVGSDAKLDNLTVTVTKMRPCKYDKEKRNEQLAKKGEKLLGAYFELEATGKEKVKLRSSFNAHDADKVPYRRTSIGGTDCKPKLRFLRLKPGEVMKGWVGFKVPESAEGLTVTYTHKQHKKDDELATFAVPE
jgi:hypothetical protein